MGLILNFIKYYSIVFIYLILYFEFFLGEIELVWLIGFEIFYYMSYENVSKIL